MRELHNYFPVNRKLGTTTHCRRRQERTLFGKLVQRLQERLDKEELQPKEDGFLTMCQCVAFQCGAPKMDSHADEKGFEASPENVGLWGRMASG